MRTALLRRELGLRYTHEDLIKIDIPRAVESTIDSSNAGVRALIYGPFLYLTSVYDIRQFDHHLTRRWVHYYGDRIYYRSICLPSGLFIVTLGEDRLFIEKRSHHDGSLLAETHFHAKGIVALSDSRGLLRVDSDGEAFEWDHQVNKKIALDNPLPAKTQKECSLPIRVVNTEDGTLIEFDRLGEKPLKICAPERGVSFTLFDEMVGFYAITCFLEPEPFFSWAGVSDEARARFRIWDFSPCIAGRAPIDVLGKAVKGIPVQFTKEFLLYRDEKHLKFVDFTGMFSLNKA